MSDGPKVIVVNTSERAVSSDINRAQTFAGAARAERARALMDTYLGNDDTDAGALSVQTLAAGTPAAAEVVAGLLVVPQLGAANLNLFVEPGEVTWVSPDAPQDPDESIARVIGDPGIQTNGALVMTANASGQPRIDVIECQRTLNVLETDSRDIFNPVTGLFSAATVNKVMAGQLVYRVRLGAPGAGRPAPISDWLPLAYALVPNGAAGNDAVTFWDVRPLITARIFSPANQSLGLPRTWDLDALLDVVTVGGKALLVGRCDLSGADLIGGTAAIYRSGGRIRRGTPGFDAPSGIDGVDLLDAANHAPDFNGAATNYVYLLSPGGLPWARYSDVFSGSRQPRSPRGILVVSATPPVSFYGCPSAPITLPASMGFGAETCSYGVCIGVWNAGVATAGFHIVRGAQYGNVGAAGLPCVIEAAASPAVLRWDLGDGSTHPANAKALLVNLEFRVSWNAAGPSHAVATISLGLRRINGAGGAAYGGLIMNQTRESFFNVDAGSAQVCARTYNLRIPWPSSYPTGATALRALVANITLATITGAAVPFMTSSNLTVVGWET